MLHGEARAWTLAGAAGLGLVGWLTAQLLTLVSYQAVHPHSGSDTWGRLHHVWDWLPATLATACAVVVMVVVAAAARGVRWTGEGATGWQSGRRCAGSSLAWSILAPAFFLIFEYAQHGVAVHAAPPTTLLVVGLVVHASFGALVPWLWTTWNRRTHSVLIAVVSAVATTVSRGVLRPGGPDEVSSQCLWSSPRRRGPPSQVAI